jgi:hypothetical protein
VLGDIPVEFPLCYQEAWLQGEYMNLPDDYYWDPKNGKEQWWIDALTVDPSKMLEGMTGLWEHGVPQPVTRTRLENASVGTLPIISVYIAVHPEHGTHVFFPYHGAKGGGGDKDAEDRMYGGFKFWYSEFSHEQLIDIVEHQYCNQPAGVAAFEKRASATEQESFKQHPNTTADFKAAYFMV